jgi:hypothetical protein
MGLTNATAPKHELDIDQLIWKVKLWIPDRLTCRLSNSKKPSIQADQCVQPVEALAQVNRNS